MLTRCRHRYAEVKMLQVGLGGWHWMDVVYILTGWVRNVQLHVTSMNPAPFPIKLIFRAVDPKKRRQK